MSHAKIFKFHESASQVKFSFLSNYRVVIHKLQETIIRKLKKGKKIKIKKRNKQQQKKKTNK